MLPRNFSIQLAALCFAACAPTVPLASPTPAPRPTLSKLGSFDPASVQNIRLEDYAVVPENISPEMRAVYQAGLAQGLRPNVFSKLGDCMTENEFFLAPFSDGDFDLGAYSALSETLKHFAGTPARNGQNWQKDSFATIGLAATGGFNIVGPLDVTWANPEWCAGSENPLACEYRVAQPSFAVLMFGTNDVPYTEAATYDFYLRTIVAKTLERNIVPLLSTFPTRPEDEAKSKLLNQIVIKVAQDYAVPLMNLNRALEPLPHHGVDPNDTIHLSVPPDERVDVFSEANLQYGFTVRNLVTLQALDAVWRAVR
jgi:hypothetical protein